MNSLPVPEITMTENLWRGLIIVLSGAVLLFTLWCLTHGITTIFMHLYYFPIVLLAYRYRWKGFGLATLLAFAYLGLVLIFNAGQSEVILGAFYRVLVFVGIAAVIAYLSERLATETKIAQESAELRERYVSLAPAIILVLDRNGAITFLNRKGGEILECNPQEITGKLWADNFLPEQERERIKQVFSQLIAGQVEQNRVVENAVLTLRGTEKIIRWYNTVLHDGSGAITGTIGFGEDITEEKRAQDNLRKMQQFQESVIANANVWISVLAPDGTILVWNDAAESLSGYKKSDVVGKNTVWKQLYPDKDYRRKVTGEIQRIIGRDEFLENFETEIRCADGATRIIVWNTRAMLDTRSVVTGYIAIGRNITDQKRLENKLRESEEKFRDIFDKANDAIEISEMGDDLRPGRYIDVNEIACRMLQYSKEEMLQHGPLDFDTTDYSRPPYDEIPGKLQSAGHATFETGHRRRDGSVIPVEIHFHVITLLGKRVGLSIVRDITDRKQAEAALWESREHYRAIINNSQLAIAVLDVNFRIIMVNARFSMLFKKPVGDFVGKYCYNEFEKRDAVCTHCPGARAMVSRKTEEVETEGVLDDGSRFSAHNRAVPFFGPDGALKGFVEMVEDITGRKRAEEALRESRQLFSDIISFLPDPTFVIDKDGKVLAWNRALEQLSGVPADDIVGKGDHGYSLWLYGKRRPVLIDLVLHPDQDAGRLNYTDIVSDGRTVTAQAEITRPVSGHKTFLSLVASPLIDPLGKTIGAIESMRDISRLRETEAELARINQNLEKIVSDRTKALEDEVVVRKQAEAAIRASLDEKVILLREIHHRVKNNLQIIISLVNLQMRQIDNPAIKQIMAETQNRVRAMSFVHEKLYRSESLSQIDFADYTRFLATQLFSFYGTDTRKVRLSLALGTIMVDINTAVPLGLIINELISNALRYAFPQGKEGTISISGGEENDLITLVVKDNGVGMPEELDWKNTTTLGMRLVTSLIDQVDGTITLDRKDGTQFTITVKRVPASGGTG